MLAPGTLATWVTGNSQTEGWQKNFLLRVIDACRAVPEASVHVDLLVDEPIITSSLELVMQSVTIPLGETGGRLNSLESAARESISQAFNSAALTSRSASEAAARETSKAVEGARSKITQLWGADQLDHKEKVKDLEDKISSLTKEVKSLKTQIKNTSGDFKSVNAEKEAAVNSALAELQRRHDSANAALCLSVSQMATQLQLVLPQWGGGAREQSSAPGAAPAPEAAPKPPTFPNDLGDKDKVKKCLSKWAQYFDDHALRVTRTDLKRIMSLLGMVDAYKALLCPGHEVTKNIIIDLTIIKLETRVGGSRVSQKVTVV